MISNLLQRATELQDELLRIRRHLHAHPELSFQEFKTSAFVCEELTSIGVSFARVGETGVVATIHGQKGTGPTIGLRADMDALPITELNQVSYASTCPGVMHACGHDVHTTWLLGAARILQTSTAEWGGAARLYFQPGEELNPGGASIMIEQGVLDTLPPSKVFGLHVSPALEVGKIGIGPGAVMASVDDISITIQGPGGHAAAPHQSVDTVLIAAEIITGLQKIVSRNKPPFSPSVLSFCTIHGGEASNVIPTSVMLGGTLRCMDEAWRQRALELIRSGVEGLAQSAGASVVCSIDAGYPAVINDTSATQYASERLQSVFQPDTLVPIPESLGGEDFAYFAQRAPASFMKVGIANKASGITAALHTPRFDIDETALPIGVAILAAMVGERS
jgi:hippurate hydrolase